MIGDWKFPQCAHNAEINDQLFQGASELTNSRARFGAGVGSFGDGFERAFALGDFAGVDVPCAVSAAGHGS